MPTPHRQLLRLSSPRSGSPTARIGVADVDLHRSLLQAQEAGRLAVQEGRPADALRSVKLELEIRERLPKPDDGTCASDAILAGLWERLSAKTRAKAASGEPGSVQ